MAADSSSNGTEAWRLKIVSSVARLHQDLKKDRQKRRVALARISRRLKNGVLSAFGGPDKLQTAFFGHLESQTAQKRRLGAIGCVGRTGNGVFGAPEISGGPKMAFFGHLEFPVDRKRRL